MSSRPDLSRRSRSRRSRSRRRGFTLLEVLIATAITLLMMLSLAQVFKIIGDTMRQGRASLQMNSTLRAVTFRLRNDLTNLTVRVDPPSDQSSGGGYLEYFDGSMTDYSTGLAFSSAENRFGDMDDILMFTARAGDSWFTGQVPAGALPGGGASSTPVTITSQLAEIAVFARPVGGGGGVFPSGFNLHYRVLLIRPDLNTFPAASPTQLPNTIASGTASTAMATLWQDYDLSMHRIFNTSDGLTGTQDYVAANSLEDLAKPENRFAHFQFALPGTSSATMPLLVLDTANYGLFGATPLPLPDPTPTGSLAGASGNFLAPAFVLSDVRTGEDILATNVLAFDIKGYDSGAAIYGTVGPDGTTGTTIDTTLGADGSDDLVFTPNDPGYGTATAGTLVSRGTYVDLMWGRKIMNTGVAFNTAFISELSGVSTGNTYSGSLLRSGKLLLTSAAPPAPILLQPTFDTWTTSFESNGTTEAEFSTFQGTCAVNALNRMYGVATNNPSFQQPWRSTVDAGTDGIDNNGSGGVDEAVEKETAPPFPVKLRGLKLSIRIEDNATRQVKQMSVASEFVTQ